MADDGETVDFCDAQAVFGACTDLAMEGSFLDELLKSTHACTHTHTCNPPGPRDAPHTHTCIHTHTHLFAQPTIESFCPQALDISNGSYFADDETLDAATVAAAAAGGSWPLKKRPPGNREAVKKYREKKKAHTAFLEEQVVQLRALNEQLLRRLQGHAALEAELRRLRMLLAEFRGRIDGELRVAYQKNPSIYQIQPDDRLLNSCNVPCKGVDLPCLHSLPETEIQSEALRDRSLSGLNVFSCERVIPKCVTARKKKAAKHSSTINIAYGLDEPQ